LPTQPVENRRGTALEDFRGGSARSASQVFWSELLEPEVDVGLAATEQVTYFKQAQAAHKAEEYLDSAFSRQALIRQLTFEGFTRKQVEHGVCKTGL